MKKRFTEAKIVGFLRELDAGVTIKELCRKTGSPRVAAQAWVGIGRGTYHRAAALHPHDCQRPSPWHSMHRLSPRITIARTTLRRADAVTAFFEDLARY